MATEKKNGIFINHYPQEMVHVRKTTDKDGKEREFASVSIACKESKTGMGTITVNMGQLLPANKKNGTTVDGRYSILLGDPDKTRKVSIATDPDGKTFETIELTNAQIAKNVDAARKEYRNSQKA